MQSVLSEVDTRAISSAGRFGFWRERFCRTVAPLEVRSEHAADFAATMQVLDLGVIRVVVHRYPSLEVDRTPYLIRRDHQRLCQLVLNLCGRVTIVQGERTVHLNADEFTLVDCSQPLHGVHLPCPGCTGQLAAITVPLGRTPLPVPVDAIGQLSATRMSGEDVVSALLCQHLRWLAQRGEQCRPPDAARLGTITRDLVAATLLHRLDAESQLPDGSLLARVDAFVDAHLTEPTLTPQAIAAAHHISIRTLHRIFRARGVTVCQWIRLRRLEGCRRDLVDRRHRICSIHAIAARWGFHDPAHFSRAFKAEYGVSPLVFRES